MTDEDFASEAREIVKYLRELPIEAWIDGQFALVATIASALRAARDRGFREGVEGAAEIAYSIDSTVEHGVNYEQGQMEMRDEIVRSIRSLLSPPSSPEPSAPKEESRG